MSKPERVDVLIIGAGPAGLTLAALLARYRPETSVLVLEKQRFPRHKIGEALVIDINRILADMGALDAVDAAGFVKKLGSTFVWGEDRTPHTFAWPEWRRAGYLRPHTWHLDRPRYDQILADCATGHGATILFEQTVLRPVLEGERVVGVDVQDGGAGEGHAGEGGRGGGGADEGTGQERRIHSRYVVDCSGPNGPLSQWRGGRTIDDKLRNVAVYGYHQGIARRPELNGNLEHARTLILTHDEGWMWVIPVTPEITSVGFMTREDTFAASGVGASPEELSAWYDSKLRSLPEAAELFADARLVDYREDGQLVGVAHELSFDNHRLWGPGWALCGDAGGFVDAILSLGCFLAQQNALFLAYALNSVLERDCEEALALDSYETTVQEGLGAFRAITHMLYAFNASPSEWWRDCSTLLRTSHLVPAGGDPGAFAAFFTGFATRNALYDDAVSSFGGHFLPRFSKALFTTESLFAEGALDAAMVQARGMLRGDPYLRVRGTVAARLFALPKVGTGRLQPALRLDVELPGAADTPAAPVSRRMFVPAALSRVPVLLDGTRRLSEITKEIIGQMTEDSAAELDGGPNRSLVPVDHDAIRKEVTKVAYRLACMGALEAVPSVQTAAQVHAS